MLNGSELEQLEPSVYSGDKTGNKFLHNYVTGMVSQDTIAVVRSAMANQRLQSSTPAFYFFFENKGAGLSNTGGGFAGFINSASSPNEFVLVRMKMRKDEREVIVGKNSNWKDSKPDGKLVVGGVFTWRPEWRVQ